jgi:tetratricopeptide (TPR) repeat protein
MADYRLFHMIIYFMLNISFLNGSLIIVCLEKNITAKDAYIIMEYQLHHLTDTLETFDEEQKCIDYISTIPLQSQPSSVYFILSDQFYDNIFPIIQQQQQIKPSIYMFAPSGTPLGFLLKERKNKFYRLFSDHKCLISALSKDLDTEEKISMSINIQDMKNVSIKCLDKESQTFLLYQMLTSSFQERQHDTTEIDDFQSVFNQYDERDISNLEQLYLFQDIIQWYTSDTFISRLLDEALRTKNIYLIFKLRFFIINLLNKSFIQNQNILLDDTGRILTSYRKEFITKEKLIKLKLNVNRLLSINEFYVTTLEKPNYTLQQSESVDMECVLFQIDIDTSTEIIRPYTIINNYRSEILFTFGTVFQIHSVELDTNTHIWNVKLIINEEVKNQVIDLIDQLGDEFGYPFDFMAMGQLMDEISENSKAIECYRIFLDETSHDDEYIPMAYKYLGLSYYQNESYIEALENYYKALQLYRLQSVSPHDHLFVDIYRLIGEAYHARHQYAIAIDYYKEAIRIEETQWSYKSMLYLYTTIGNAYSKIGDEQKYHEYL